MEPLGVGEMILHSGFQMTLGSADVNLVSETALGLVEDNRMSATVVVATCGFIGIKIAVARESFEIRRHCFAGDLGREVSVEEFSDVGESVIGHRHTKPG